MAVGKCSLSLVFCHSLLLWFVAQTVRSIAVCCAYLQSLLFFIAVAAACAGAGAVDVDGRRCRGADAFAVVAGVVMIAVTVVVIACVYCCGSHCIHCRSHCCRFHAQTGCDDS